jgi:hypothetical protein
MTLPGKNEKGYLEITDWGDGFAIHASKQHAEELEPLFQQHGISCRRDVGPESDTLVFDVLADREKVRDVLAGYEQAKGS